MKKFITPMLAVILFIGSAFVVLTPPAEYKIKDSHAIAFKSKDPSGTFKTVNGTVKWDDADLENSKFDLKIPVSSINTGNGMQNKKAQTAEWFDAAKYPDVKFVSSKIVKSGSDYKVTGKFTIKATTKEKTFVVKVVKSGTDVTFSGNLAINRLDFKVGKPSEAVPETMLVTFSLPVSKK